MEDKELKEIDDFVIELRRMSQTVYLAYDAEVAVDVCVKINRACKLINKLTQDNINLRGIE
tara:strand:+ start:1768 stop:1950 length:183 start_codon:yes stop_codon:yes gene_type:complete